MDLPHTHESVPRFHERRRDGRSLSAKQTASGALRVFAMAAVAASLPSSLVCASPPQVHFDVSYQVGCRDVTPPDFLEALAKEAIDNGADLFCAHGPFDFRAIEIYRGKPIFYGLGSFIRQPYQQDYVPWETYSAHTFTGRRYESVNPLDTTVPDAEFLTTRTGRHPARAAGLRQASLAGLRGRSQLGAPFDLRSP